MLRCDCFYVKSLFISLFICFDNLSYWPTSELTVLLIGRDIDKVDFLADSVKMKASEFSLPRKGPETYTRQYVFYKNGQTYRVCYQFQN